MEKRKLFIEYKFKDAERKLDKIRKITSNHYRKKQETQIHQLEKKIGLKNEIQRVSQYFFKVTIKKVLQQTGQKKIVISEIKSVSSEIKYNKIKSYSPELTCTTRNTKRSSSD